MQKKVRLFYWCAIIGLSFSVTTGYAMEEEKSEVNTFMNMGGNVSVSVADGDTVEITSEGSDMSYDVTEINAKAGDTITIRYVNASTMPHNVVLLDEESSINPVGIAALQASKTDYVPESEKDKIFGDTKLAVPGKAVYLTLTVPPAGSYPYICTYPGHFRSMQGRLISTE
ncbi:MAG: plastocyanin/azurin family copper-binding protein [Balneolales bacterium]